MRIARWRVSVAEHQGSILEQNGIDRGGFALPLDLVADHIESSVVPDMPFFLQHFLLNCGPGQIVRISW